MVDVVIGILLAPAKGSETWKKWVGGLNDLKDKRVDKEKEKASQGISRMEIESKAS